VDRLLAEAATVLAANPRLRLDSFAAGPKPVPADCQPVLGRVDAVDGCHVAFSHSGATLGLIAGELLADEIVTGEPHPLLGSFRPSRFCGPQVIARFVIYEGRTRRSGLDTRTRWAGC
jgi:glycine/D-amino acid oxidase-like deaminating enzyme